MSAASEIKITWFGHAMFLMVFDDTRIATDPYDAPTGYSQPHIKVDVVTLSHQHHDHNDTSALKGNPTIINTAGNYSINDTAITGIDSYHDEVQGQKRGTNIIFIFTYKDFTVAHMGDYGQEITLEHRALLDTIDVLFIPVGGKYTIDAENAASIVKLLQPRIAIPMHYKTRDSAIDIAPVEPFLERVPVVRNINRSNITIKESDLPDNPEVWVMDYELSN